MPSTEQPPDDAAPQAEQPPHDAAPPLAEPAPAEAAPPVAEQAPAEAAPPAAEQAPAEAAPPQAEQAPAEAARPRAEPARASAPRAERSGGEPDRRRRGGGGGFRRRKVCGFCVDNVRRIDYKDPAKLRRYLSDRGRIEPRRKTGTCAKHQRWLTTALKRARHLALLPYTPEHIRGAGTFAPRR